MSNHVDLTIEELADRLPSREPHPELQEQISGFGYVGESNPLFVPPRLTLTDAPDADDVTVVIVSAPAAVGKSTFAAELAHRTGAPLWDLAQFQVGSHSFEGILATAYGMQSATELVNDLEDGEFALVMDALDEGQLRAGTQNFQAFLDDLTQTLSGATGGPSLVAFARTETADDLHLNCLENDVPVVRYQIGYFNREQAFEFIDNHLDAICEREDESPTHRGHRGPFERARDTLVDLVVRLLEPTSDPWDSDVVRGFLGYAPVLEAISRYLRVDNHSALQANLETASESFGDLDQVHLWEFLADIVESVMEREQEKVRDNLREHLEQQADRVGFADWDVIYTNEEQRFRLLHRYLLETSPPDLPEELPPALRGPYEERIETSITQHPFIRRRSGEFANVVFRDFLYAKTLATDQAEGAEAVRSAMSGQSLFTPLFGRFLLSFADDDTEPQIFGEDFSHLYESLRSESRDDHPIFLTLQQAPNTSTVVGMMAAEGEVTPDVRFRLTLREDGIQFLRRLSNAEVNLDGSVTLGTEGGSFTIGPNVKLDCQQVRPAAESIQIRTEESPGDAGPNVLLLAERYRSLGAPPDIYPLGSADEIRVYWPDIAYPWVDYRLESRPTEDVGDEELVESLKYLSRILTFFRSYGYGGLGRRTTTINEAAVGESELAEDLLEYLLEDGLVRREGQFFHLDTDRLDAHGVTWADVMNRTMSEGVERLLTDFLQRRQ